ncbi:xanthine dehydrogenase family protein subunit M [Frigidibacter albus]|uniref:Xanthine dehydrogenase family protein subunit M n=1 Tax=Frigidibacter albus TaxID=1465486 RepID=A0A6L8VPR1_9RHOB|nr:xanthine dehydrogenase family protein subunit M [Frigidibacter albus]MZQ91140.1 xanthine dehydrogenase family protein subunit M [Frigidibacter albus]NBE33049.1 xanthine dehydrogenase family protein subunit M [Frigidibacter albus]GGH62997.1 carbon monoxide dehydrogenase [Frigidibacter albus]
MKPARFDYVRPDSVDQALDLLARYGGDAKIIAGGQSLMPMMNFRLVKPAVLVDINRIPGLEVIEDQGERVRMGALARHRMTATDSMIASRIPVLHDAMHHVAHMTVRNRGTFCGSVCHADPAAEIPMIVLMLDGQVEVASASRRRVLPAAEFLVGSLVTALEADEMVTGITIGMSDPQSGWAFEEFSRRHGDFALAAVAVTLGVDADGAIRNPRIGMTGVGETAMRMRGVEALIDGCHPDEDMLGEVSEWLNDNLVPNTDIHAGADYRRHLSGVLAGRAIRAAYARARTLRGKQDE